MGKRTKIAPQLTALLNLALHTKAGGLIGLRATKAELRALLAEVRALRRYKKRHGIVFATGRGPDPEGRALLRAMERTDRLSRASGGSDR